MIKTSITVNNKAGLHARAAARFVETASKFSSSIELGTDENMVDGKSILAIMLLAAPLGTELDLIIDGDDEAEASKAILLLVENRFEED
jgi:phosphocarrier protein HPr